MTPEETARAAARAVVNLSAKPMMNPDTFARGAALGFSGIDFYFAGRAGVLGEVDAEIVSAAMVFFHPDVVREAWEHSRGVLPRLLASQEFAHCLGEWADANLLDGDGNRLGGEGDGDGIGNGDPADGRRNGSTTRRERAANGTVLDDAALERVAELAGLVIEDANAAGIPLFAAWRAANPAKRATSARQAAVQQLNLLREFRGGLHGLAVLAAGLEPGEAVHIRTPDMASVFGWDDVDGSGRNRELWQDAEARTNRLMGRAFEVLTEDERVEFVSLLEAIYIS
jgi:hypothetical protein